MKKLENVLLVDDDEIVCLVTKHVLMEHNDQVKVSTVFNGEEAVNYFTSANGEKPELILLDINMPLMDGFEFLDWYRNNGNESPTKIAMFSTSVMPADKDRALSYPGVIDYIEKPLSDDKIDMLLSKIY